MADFGTVARPYARAVFDLALAANQLEGWASALSAAAVVTGNKTAREYLGRPELSAVERSEFIGSICASLPDAALLATAEGRNLLLLLSENDRLDAVGEISKQFDELKADQENKVKVTLVTAAPVDADQVDKVATALSKKLGRSVELVLELDVSLVGGAVIRAKDMVIDDSLQTRLQRLASALAN
jgi:F-type H+-transporting ATPase subunit delta